MKISKHDMDRFKDMSLTLRSSGEDWNVRAGYSMLVLITRVEELEARVKTDLDLVAIEKRAVEGAHYSKWLHVHTLIAELKRILTNS